MRDVVVIGAGLAGLSAAIKAADAGLSVTLVTKGVGGIQLGTGTVDILGYRPEPVEAPLEALEGHVAWPATPPPTPTHPPQLQQKHRLGGDTKTSHPPLQPRHPRLCRRIRRVAA